MRRSGFVPQPEVSTGRGKTMPDAAKKRKQKMKKLMFVAAAVAAGVALADVTSANTVG